jgi:hypothetical protein
MLFAVSARGERVCVDMGELLNLSTNRLQSIGKGRHLLHKSLHVDVLCPPSDRLFACLLKFIVQEGLQEVHNLFVERRACHLDRQAT